MSTFETSKSELLPQGSAIERVTVGGRVARAMGRERTPSRLSVQESFAQALGKRMDQGRGPQKLSPEDQAREAAEGLVSQTFVQPLLKAFRQTTWAKPPFAPTQAEKQFRSLMDVGLAQSVVSSGRFPLVDRLAKDLLKRQGLLAEAAEISGGSRVLAASPPPLTPPPITTTMPAPGAGGGR